MLRLTCAAFLAISCAGSVLALADDEPEAEVEPAPAPATRPARPPAAAVKSRPAVYPHRGQIGIYTQFGLGYRAIFRYQNNDFCGQAGKSACTMLEAPWIEIGLDYAPSNKTEVIFDVRLGLGDDIKPESSSIKAPHQLVFAPGVRIYLDDRSATKLFTTLQLVIDRTDYSVDNVSGSTDVGFRTVTGFLFDVHQAFGIYLHLGVTATFVRWLDLALDGGIGLQARFP